MFVAMLAAVQSHAVWAAPQELRDQLEVVDVDEVAPALAQPLAPASDGWVWLRLRDPAALEDLGNDWHLAIDQTRFSNIAVAVDAEDASFTFVRGEDDLAANWAYGGRLNFEIPRPASEIKNLYIGFEDLDTLTLMRSVQAASNTDFADQQQGWLLLMGIFAGLLVSSFIYNLFLFIRERQSFQAWYLCWVAAALAYGLSWTNLFAFWRPELAGPDTVRLNYILVSLVIALGSNFLLAVLERGVVPAQLKHLVRWTSLATILLGMLAADERRFDPASSDLFLNIALVVLVGLSLVAVGIAWKRGSRIVRYFTLGWTPVVLAFAGRSARNFGLLPQSDWVDMATFIAIALESLLFSLAIANRFSDLRLERDRAAEAARAARQKTAMLRRAAEVDHLTGLGNRSTFYPRLETAVQADRPVELFLIDVDFLKSTNDRYGHSVGDALLQHVGIKLQELEGTAIRVARIGGDEFAIMVEGELALGERVRAHLQGLQGTVWKGEGSLALSLSVGSAIASKGNLASDLFRDADLALYEAKRNGRGRYQPFDRNMQARYSELQSLKRDAPLGLSRDEFILRFQPIFDLETGLVASYEALLRWRHPEKGLLTPKSFAELFEQDRLGVALQERVFALAFEAIRAGIAPLSVNFTTLDLGGEAAAYRLLDKMEQLGISPESLCAEVTEGVILDPEAHDQIAALHVLHDAGVKIALDDFGTGYASLVHLKTIPFDVLKIDQSFVRDVEPGDNELIVRAIIALGQGMGKTVIAEGIETTDQLRQIRELGCNYGQGFLLGRPASRDAYALRAVA